jgi:hypothetical protein
MKYPDHIFLKYALASQLIKLIRCGAFGFMKYTQATLDRVEKILDEAGYIVRYERGNFQSGYCILEERKVVVLNKFLQMEGRINTLIDIIPQLSINIELFSPETKKVYDEVIAKYEAGNSIIG